MDDDALCHLTDIGFTEAGRWKIVGQFIDCELNEELAKKSNVLYAFAVNGRVMYVGKTVQRLSIRMAGYKRQVLTQSTNIKNNINIRTCLSEKMQVTIHVLPDNGMLRYGKLHFNLAAGLEDSIVRTMKPQWNGGKKEATDESMQPTLSA